MRRAVATRIEAADPASAIAIIDIDIPPTPPGWTLVEVKAASLNRHDLWSIAGVGVDRKAFPIGLSSDIAGVTASGRRVVAHPLVVPSGPASEGALLDADRRMLAEASGGGLSEWIAVPDANLIEIPEQLSFDVAATLPTAWLTAFRMLFTVGNARTGQSVLVQGAGGGVSTAAIMLAVTAGLRVWVTSRTPERRERAIQIGAAGAFEPGARLPERVDIVIESVGAATWEHSMNCVRPGGSVIVAGATSGQRVPMDLARVFIQHVAIRGSALGTLAELASLIDLVAEGQIQPLIDTCFPLDRAADAVGRLSSGAGFGKVIVNP